MKKLVILLLLATCAVLISGCEKFLDERPDKNLVIPKKLDDLQAMLDYNNIMNAYPRGVSEASADNYYLTDASWASASDSEREIYIWGDELFFDKYTNQWSDMYQCINVTNYVLETLPTIDPVSYNQADGNNTKGMALFFRAFTFHGLATGWANQYDSATAPTDLGIPLRLTSDFTEPSVRASVQHTYDQIIADLKQAIRLLPSLPRHVMRPGRAAAYALLSRVYLSMRRYEEAGLYTDSCLQLVNTLLDFNTLNPATSYPVPEFNAEVIFQAIGTMGIINDATAKVDSSLYDSYHADDLRKSIFFKNNPDGSNRFRGSYNGSGNLFVGIAADEVYLNKAESEARKGNTTEAMNTLNTLLSKRWKAGTFVPFTAADAHDALSMILSERRKELLFRELRWMDLKRLNKEAPFQKTVKRFLNGQWYELPPNSARYALPLPAYVINMTGMPQNPR